MNLLTRVKLIFCLTARSRQFRHDKFLGQLLELTNITKWKNYCAVKNILSPHRRNNERCVM